MLSNSSSWYNIKESELKQLEEIDELTMLKLLSAPHTTPRVMLFLELGSMPLRYVIMQRRLMFLHYLLNENEDTLVSKFFHSQNRNQLKEDWCLTVKFDLISIGLNKYTYKEIREMTKLSFAKLVKQAVRKKAFLVC